MVWDRNKSLSLEHSLRRAAAVYANKIASIHNGRCRTWAEVSRRVGKIAGLIASNGLGDGDRVAVLALNSDTYFEIFLAVWQAGCVIVPLNSRWSPAENIYALNDCGARLLFLGDAFFAQAPTFRDETSVEGIIRLGETARGEEWPTVARFMEDDEFPAHSTRGGHDLAAIFYTGGTTGFPKGVMLSHLSLMVNGLSFAPLMQVDHNSVYLHGPPLFHAAAGGPLVTLTMFSGTQVFVERFDPKEVIRTIAEHRVTHALLVPAMIHMFLEAMEEAPDDLSSLKVLIYGASAMPEALLRRAMTALPGVKFVQAYGQTELSPVATALLPEDHVLEGPQAGRIRSAGRAIPNSEVAVTDPSGRPLPVGEVGEIRVRGPHVMLGYWNKPDLTAETIVDGWCRTGDAGYFDQDRYLYVVDRVKDMIVTGGENVYSAEVENTLLKHPKVRQCAVIGVPSDKWGEEVHAVIVPNDGAKLELDDLVAHCRTLIASYKCPRSMTLKTELPLSAAGKILKRDLRAPFWQGKDRNVN